MAPNNVVHYTSADGAASIPASSPVFCGTELTKVIIAMLELISSIGLGAVAVGQ